MRGINRGGGRLTLALAATACIVASLADGCSRRFEDKWSRSRPRTYPAVGRVLWNGEPVENAIVALDSLAHKVTAVGTTDAEGIFKLETYRPGDGAVAGEHLVRIEKLETTTVTADGITQVSVLPQRYADAKKSRLTATVTADGKTTLSFELTGSKFAEK